MLVALFVDIRAVLDSVDRGVLVEAMRERGMRMELIKRIEKIFKGTRSRIRTEGEVFGR